MSEIITEARSWIGTPYQHRMSLKGIGCDCLGLVRGVWRTVIGPEPTGLPAYSPDWAEVGGSDVLLNGLAVHFVYTKPDQALPGDVIVFRMRRGAVAKHAAILSAGEGLDDPLARVIHAYWGHAVVESWLGTYWRRCAVAAFRFPLSPLCRAANPHLKVFAATQRLSWKSGFTG